MKQISSQSKIAVFIPNLCGGGAERAMLNLVTEFTKRGTPIDFVTIEAKGPYVNFLPKEVHLIELQPQLFKHLSLLQSRFLQLLKHIAIVASLVKHIKKSNIHILLTTLRVSNIISLIIKKYFIKEIMLIVRIENTLSIESSKSKSWKTRFVTKILKSLLPIANAIIVNSKGSSDDIKLHIPTVSHLVHIIYNPIVSSNIKTQAVRPIHHPWIGDTGFNLILSVGRLEPQKDLATLLKAFAELIKLQSSRLIILGQGPEEHNLKKISNNLGIKSFVDFVGFQLNPFSWMAKADVFVLSSLFEGLPNALIEAMACGTPVVSTNCHSGPREILKGGKLGKLVPVGDYKELASAVMETLKKPIASTLLMKRAQDFSIDLSTDKYTNIIKSMEKK